MRQLVGKTFWKTQILARGRRGKARGRFGGVPGGDGVGQGSAGQLGELVDRGPDVVPLALTVDVMHVGAGVADDFHAYVLSNALGLHGGDEGGAEAMEALLGLATLAGG